jgi:hypothetical protein
MWSIKAARRTAHILPEERSDPVVVMEQPDGVVQPGSVRLKSMKCFR